MMKRLLSEICDLRLHFSTPDRGTLYVDDEFLYESKAAKTPIELALFAVFINGIAFQREW